MKVQHVISSVSKRSGGTSTYVQSICNELSKSVEIELTTINSTDNIEFNDDVKLKFFEKDSLQLFMFNKFKKYFNFVKTDLFHGHGLWELPVHVMSKIARKTNTPYIISPHGTLEPWSLSQGTFKKKLARKTFQDKDLLKADCIHATCLQEANNIRALGFKNPIAVIPNGVDTNYFKPLENKREKKIIFISRIHPKKGIEKLIDAWAEISEKDRSGWKVDVIGTGDFNYIKKLKAQIKKKGLDNQMHLVGAIYGSEKLKAYQNASFFVLPTYSENFGIVVAEALACGTPVITTKGAPWSELNTENAGWWIDIGVQPLRKALSEAINLDANAIENKGKNGRKLALKKYSNEAVKEQLFSLYKWVLKKEKRPKFIM